MEFDKETYHLPDINKSTAAIIGLGYVGLPLAVEIAKKQKSHLSGEKLERKVIGFDINNKRIEELKNGYDRTNEISQCHNLSNVFDDLTNNFKKLIIADIFIITVPTPIDKYMKPDLTALKNASITVAKALKLKKEIEINSKKRTIPIVIYESTVYPGTTEEICIPLIEKESGLSCDSLKNFKSFYCGYSPERINPGDKKHTISDIVKVTSGSNEEASIWINNFYMSIISAGTYKAQSIKIAEAAKIIENTQRDINIALVNELAIIFKLLKIDTLDVLKAASTKWNFLPFKPGLVGGHCIGVDPYYLTWKSEQSGYKPEVVLSGREVNEKMTEFLLGKIIKNLNKFELNSRPPTMVIFGITFKEDCPDIRNSKVIDFIKLSKDYGFNLNIYDPIADIVGLDESIKKYVIEDFPKDGLYDVVFLAVPHRSFKQTPYKNFNSILSSKGFIFDLKGILGKRKNVIRL